MPGDTRRAAGRIAAAASALCAHAILAQVASAHGDVTGAQDIIQDYGVLLFLLAVVLIGAGVLAWVLLAPQPEAADTPEGDAGQAS